MASIPRRRLFEAAHAGGFVKGVDLACEACINALCEYHNIDKSNISEEVHKKTSTTIKTFVYRLRKKWIECSRNLEYFNTHNKEWLDKELSFNTEIETFLAPDCNTVTDPPTSEVPGTSQGEFNVGRPAKDWDSLSDRSKKRKAHHLLEDRDPKELIYAASKGVYKKNANLKYVLKFAMLTPSRPTKIRKLISEKKPEPVKFTSEEALSLLIETDMTKQSYQTVRLAAKSKHADIYPPYNDVLDAKKACYPDNISVTEDSAKVPIQSLLDHTTLRIIQQEKEKITQVIENLEEDEQLNCDLVCKWGFDGSSGQSEYKQKSAGTLDDSSMFCTTLVPLQLKFKDNILWQNPVPSSTRFCRPIHLLFKKESTELCQEVNKSVHDEIKKLQPLDATLDIDYELACEENRKENIQVKYDLHLTMVDQKVLNALTETKSSMRCYYLWGYSQTIQ
ncbi:LOW QUALITY PROTEIN: uncharacterized protein [Amphiura filiformis]|uniref:LOW QUALITY PROTEIN: uncharacterized protein n=1 Tax=Amphiura filiformis TaxID=82378 RepID=UPI003B222E04